MQLKIFEKPIDIQISRITDSLSLNILSDLSLPHQVREATHLFLLVFLRGKNKIRSIIAQLIINSLRSKFAFLSSQITKYVDILLLSETKLQTIPFPKPNFH